MDNTKPIIAGHYTGDRMELFKLAMVTSLLTMATLGIYRFWAKTRIRKYIWSSISGKGDRFEYTGTGIEKLLGFLAAIVILAIYLGVIQMILFYFGLNLFSEPTSMAELIAQTLALYISVLAVVPLLFFAQYRARRYKMARSRWRGVRFGVENGAWGYAIRAIGHWILTLLTLGLLLPRQTFLLEKYITDRSWYGSAKFEQQGRWQEMFPAVKHLGLGIFMMVIGTVLAAVANAPALGGLLVVVGYFWTMIGYVSYRVRSFEYLTSHKVLDGDIGFRAAPETSTVVGHILLGGIVVALISSVLLGVVFAILRAFIDPVMAVGNGNQELVGIAFFALYYLFTLMVVSSLSLVWITQPILQHAVSSIVINNADALDAVRQRATDEGADAEGFADALDVGGAI